jgi:hypothetical protein
MNESLATPLHWAAAEGKTDVVKFFVERWPEGVAEGVTARIRHSLFISVEFIDPSTF